MSKAGPARLSILIAALYLVASAPSDAQSLAEEQRFDTLRSTMVREQIRPRGGVGKNVERAMGEVPRHRFVPDGLQSDAYTDRAIAIGEGQTISQPYIVAVMTSLLELDKDDKVLEIGTGSGYQAAVLSRLAGKVYSMEIIEPLARKAAAALAELGYDNVEIRVGDGTKGWPQQAPFDAVIVTAAPEKIPAALIAQLKVGGRLVIPVGAYFQDLYLVTKINAAGEIEKKRITPVRFGPMIE